MYPKAWKLLSLVTITNAVIKAEHRIAEYDTKLGDDEYGQTLKTTALATNFHRLFYKTIEQSVREVKLYVSGGGLHKYAKEEEVDCSAARVIDRTLMSTGDLFSKLSYLLIKKAGAYGLNNRKTLL